MHQGEVGGDGTSSDQRCMSPRMKAAFFSAASATSCATCSAAAAEPMESGATAAAASAARLVIAGAC